MSADAFHILLAVGSASFFAGSFIVCLLVIVCFVLPVFWKVNAIRTDVSSIRDMLDHRASLAIQERFTPSTSQTIAVDPFSRKAGPQ